MKFDGIIFDLDGTLWDSADVICKAWNKVLSKYENINVVITVEKMHSCMGLLMEEIIRRLLPKVEEERRLQILHECCDMEQEYLNKEGGILYPQLEETLAKLSQNHRLFIVSNCQDGYIQSFFEAHKLDKYFEDFESAGKTGLSKGENNKLVITRNNLKKAVYVGDTQGDADSAIIAGIPFVYAKYGFGNVKLFEYEIDSFSELLGLDL